MNKLAAFIVDEVTNDEPRHDDDDGKNPAAVALGRLGGPNGAPASECINPERRREIAQQAAAKRWATA